MTKKQNRSKYLNVRLSGKEDEIIKEEAMKAGMKKSDFIRQMLYKGIPPLRRKRND